MQVTLITYLNIVCDAAKLLTLTESSKLHRDTNILSECTHITYTEQHEVFKCVKCYILHYRCIQGDI